MQRRFSISRQNKAIKLVLCWIQSQLVSFCVYTQTLEVHVIVLLRFKFFILRFLRLFFVVRHSQLLYRICCCCCCRLEIEQLIFFSSVLTLNGQLLLVCVDTEICRMVCQWSVLMSLWKIYNGGISHSSLCISKNSPTYTITESNYWILLLMFFFFFYQIFDHNNISMPIHYSTDSDAYVTEKKQSLLICSNEADRKDQSPHWMFIV